MILMHSLMITLTSARFTNLYHNYRSVRNLSTKLKLHVRSLAVRDCISMASPIDGFWQTHDSNYIFCNVNRCSMEAYNYITLQLKLVPTLVTTLIILKLSTLRLKEGGIVDYCSTDRWFIIPSISGMKTNPLKVFYWICLKEITLLEYSRSAIFVNQRYVHALLCSVSSYIILLSLK